MNIKNKIVKLRIDLQIIYKRLPDDMVLDIKKELIIMSDLLEKEVSKRALNDEHSGGI